MNSRPAGNPWLSIWTKPRLTIAEIIHTNPSYRFFFLCFIYGFMALLNAGQRASLGNVNSAGAIILTSAILGFFVGFVAFSIYSLLLTWTGKWIGGKGSYREIRAAVAWSNVPVVVDLVVWLALAAVLGSTVFTEDFARVIYYQTSEGGMFLLPEPRLLLVVGFIRLALSIWSLIIFLLGLSEVQGFSVFKAILNALFSIFVVVAAVWIASLAAWWLQGFIQR